MNADFVDLCLLNGWALPCVTSELYCVLWANQMSPCSLLRFPLTACSLTTEGEILQLHAPSLLPIFHFILHECFDDRVGFTESIRGGKGELQAVDKVYYIFSYSIFI